MKQNNFFSLLRASFFLSVLFFNSCTVNQSPSPTDQKPVSTTFTGCCTTSNGFLFEYVNINSDDQKIVKDLCSSASKGTWSDTKCSTTGVVGGCKYTKTSPDYTQWYVGASFPNQNEDQLKAANCVGENRTWVKP